jgi:16S rRNA (cytosine1402-N4)-methyltransferase
MHVPVLADRVVEILDPALAGRRAVLVDATVGLGGHAEVLLSRHPDLQVVGVDRDPAALAAARERLVAFQERVELVHAAYHELARVLDHLSIDRVDGVVFDLGVSSLQLDDPARGFSYSRDGGLDMRMDTSTGRTAADVLATYPLDELARVLRDYGEERYARRIAGLIVRERTRHPLTSSARLVELVRQAIPAPARREGGHPAKRTFQALRIEVNGELESLRLALPAAIAALRVGGRIVVLAYHSLEDRLVKRAFVARAVARVPDGLPVVPESAQPELRLLTRRAERPSAVEVAANPRAASARLRAAERIRGVAA